MECLSPAFVTAARRALTSAVRFLGTVALLGGGFIAEVKRSPGGLVLSLSAERRDLLPAELAARFRAARP
jgi:nucleoside-triphosphatase